MRSWLNELGLLLSVGIALATTTGCQSGGNFDAIEREIRWKEDRIYYLEDHVEDYKKRLASARRENETLRRQLEEAGGGGGADSWNSGGGGSAPLASPPSSSGPSGLPPIGGGTSGSTGTAGEAPSFDGAPIISPPGEGVPEGIGVPGDGLAPPSGTSPGTGGSGLPAPRFDGSGGGADASPDRMLPDDAPKGGLSYRQDPDEYDSGADDDQQPASTLPSFKPASQRQSSQTEELLPPPPSFEDASFKRLKRQTTTPAATAKVDATYPLPTGDEQVAKVTLNGLLTGGHDTSDELGDEGVMVVVEPRNTADEIVDVAGTVEIAVVDPQLSGTAREVARWRFAPEEASQRFRETILGAGMHFDLPWPNRPPEHETLKLHVRYTTPEGEKFTLNEEIKVDPPATGATAIGRAPPDKRTRLLPPHAVDQPRSQAESEERMARIGRPRFYHGEEPDPDEMQRGSSETDAPQSDSLRGRDTGLTPPAWTPYR